MQQLPTGHHQMNPHSSLGRSSQPTDAASRIMDDGRSVTFYNGQWGGRYSSLLDNRIGELRHENEQLLSISATVLAKSRDPKDPEAVDRRILFTHHRQSPQYVTPYRNPQTALSSDLITQAPADLLAGHGPRHSLPPIYHMQIPLTLQQVGMFGEPVVIHPIPISASRGCGQGRGRSRGRPGARRSRWAFLHSQVAGNELRCTGPYDGFLESVIRCSGALDI